MPTLAEKNPHERDARMTFDPVPHIYYIDGKKVKASVTTILHKYFTFDAAKVSKKCSQRYKKDETSEYFGLSPEGIIQKWKGGAQRGTDLHQNIEDYYNSEGTIIPENPVTEFGYFLNFVKDFPELKPFRSEWMVYDEELGLAGSIDMIYINPDDTLSIYDWKCSKGIKKDNFKGELALPPLHRFQNCNFNQYSLQLNVYKWIIEKHYGYKVKDLYLVVLHDSNPNYQLEPVEDLQDYVEVILEDFEDS